MVVTIQYQKMPISESLSLLLLKKMNRLAAKYQWLIKAHVLFKEENNRTGDGKVCEIELSAPGPRLFAKSNTNNFEKAMAETIKELKRQLEKRQGVFIKH